MAAVAAACGLVLGSGTAAAQGSASVKAKSWPVGYFFKHQKATLKERERIFQDIEAKLKQINDNKEALVVKGTIIGPVRTDIPQYPQVTIFDESGLKVMVRRFPNIYYGFAGPPGAINKNVYLVAHHLKLNRIESNMTYSFVVEGDFLAFAHNYMTEMLKDLGRGERRRQEGER